MLRKRKPRKRSAVAIPIQQLEARQMLTGNVSVTTSGNNLRVTGDRAANQIEIFERDNEIIVQAAFGSGTNVRGGNTGIAANRLNNVSIRMRGGDDALYINSLDVGGDLQIATSGGQDFTQFRGRNSIAGNTSIRTGGDRDFLYTDGMDFGGRFNLATGGGNDFVLLGTGFERISFRDRVNVSMGSGSDAFELSSFATVTFAGAGHRINGGSGFDNLFPLTGQFQATYGNVSVRSFEM